MPKFILANVVKILGKLLQAEWKITLHFSLSFIYNTIQYNAIITE